MNARVFVITGPSGVGKGTLIRDLRERVDGPRSLDLGDDPLAPSRRSRRPRLLLPRSRRVRPPRRAGEFLEHATYSGNRYGTLREEVDRRIGEGHSVVLEIEVQGARQVRAATGDETVLIFIAPPDPSVLRERLAGRGTDTEEAIERRLETAKQELEAQQEFKHVIVNDELLRAAQKSSSASFATSSALRAAHDPLPGRGRRALTIASPLPTMAA